MRVSAPGADQFAAVIVAAVAAPCAFDHGGRIARRGVQRGRPPMSCSHAVRVVEALRSITHLDECALFRLIDTLEERGVGLEEAVRCIEAGVRTGALRATVRFLRPTGSDNGPPKVA